MIQPDFKTFSGLARQGNLVPVYETYTADLLTPVGAYLRIARKAKYSFLLESVEGGETIARYTFAGANPAEVFRARGRSCTLETGGKLVRSDEDPVERLRRLTRRFRPVRVPGLPPSDRRSHRLFRLRHGAAGRAHSGNRPRRRRPRRLRDDVLSGPAGVRSRAAPRLDHSQRVHRRRGQPARKIRRCRPRDPEDAPNARRAVAETVGSAARRAAARPLEHDEIAVHGRRAKSEVLHSRGRCVSDRRQPAIRGPDKRRAI